MDMENRLVVDKKEGEGMGGVAGGQLRQPGSVHFFPIGEGHSVGECTNTETASLSLLSGRWTAQTLLATVVDYIDSFFLLQITLQC